MKTKLIATIGCLVLSCALHAQGNWLPPVNFPVNTNVCDPSPWQLVLFDDFNGTTLSPKWITYYSWLGMERTVNGQLIRADHDQWSEARCQTPYNSIASDQNVIVSNGTVKLLMKYDPNVTWNYPGGTSVTKMLSGATLNLPYTTTAVAPLYSQNLGFNNGLFEARIKYPKADGLWCNFWLYQGTQVDEVDIAEVRTGDGQWESWLTGNRDHVAHAVHAFVPNNNPYFIYGESNISENYPNQNWWNYFWGTNLNINSWHVYRCQWDTASCAFFIDNTQVRNLWKYNRSATLSGHVVHIGGGCIVSGQTEITRGYCWEPRSISQLRFGASFKESVNTTAWMAAHLPAFTIDQMEIDYVKAYQRHPEDGHTAICADNTYPTPPAITGSNEVCGAVTYTLSPAITGGSWSSFNSDILQITNLTSSSVTVAKGAGSAFNQGWISFSYGNGVAGCPNKTVSKNGLYCNRSTNWDIVSPYVLNGNGEGWFHFISDLYHKRDVINGTTPIVSWDISINIGQDNYESKTALNYVLKGQYVSTPKFRTDNNQAYNIRWTMNVTDASGTYSRSGERNSTTALMKQNNNPNTAYMNAYIDDQDYYDAIVENGISSQMISEEESNDNLYLNEMFEKVKAEALEPYIISAQSRPTSVTDSTLIYASETKVYPNPIQTIATFIPKTDFKDSQEISLYFYDFIGRCIFIKKMHYQKGNTISVDLSGLQEGGYILELQQGNIKDHIKITKGKS